PDIEAICSNYAQMWFGDYWPSYNEDEKAELRIEAHRWLKCWSGVSSAERHCQKCGTPTQGEEAWIDGQIWCHPCADAVSVTSTTCSPPVLCAGGIDPGFDECPKCGATMDERCAFAQAESK